MILHPCIGKTYVSAHIWANTQVRPYNQAGQMMKKRATLWDRFRFLRQFPEADTHQYSYPRSDINSGNCYALATNSGRCPALPVFMFLAKLSHEQDWVTAIGSSSDGRLFNLFQTVYLHGETGENELNF
jgi:hypothetical protein